jgi:hypothetical protein
MSSPIGQFLPSLVNNLWWKNITDDWKLDEKSLGKRQVIPNKKLQGMTNNVGLAFSVGDTTSQFTISIEQDN